MCVDLFCKNTGQHHGIANSDLHARLFDVTIIVLRPRIALVQADQQDQKYCLASSHVYRDTSEGANNCGACVAVVYKKQMLQLRALLL